MSGWSGGTPVADTTNVKIGYQSIRITENDNTGGTINCTKSGFGLDLSTLNNGESFTIENVNRVTTAGPIVIDSLEISYIPSTDRYHVKPHIKNEGQTLTLEDLSISMFSDDTTIIAIAGNLFVNSIAPGEIIIHPAHFYVQVD